MPACNPQNTPPARSSESDRTGDHHRPERLRQRHRAQGAGGSGLLLGGQPAHRSDPEFAELTKNAPNIRRAALVVDIREGAALEKLPGAVQAHPPPGAHAAAVPGSRRRRPDPPFQRNPPAASAGNRPERRGQHPPGARAPGAHPRAWPIRSSTPPSSTCMSCARPSTTLSAAASSEAGNPGAGDQFRLSPRRSGR